jgi:chemotaxis protein methyltransferase CheR
MTIDTGLLQRFTQLIASHVGLQIRREETDRLCQSLRSRMAHQQLLNPEEYYRLLATGTASSRHEWEELILLLTIGETYFFRDSGQFSLLRHQVLPELIDRNKRTRSLRIWSAGCSTGEEPYSLAILVHELLPAASDWTLLIIGTDVNKHAITAARRGVYQQHALRALDQGRRGRYFRQHRGEWELDGRFREMVSFRQLNLLKDPFPDVTANLSEVDLILCRNVFIYFDRAAVTQVVSKFAQTLRVGGYLITGHAELHDQKSNELSVKAFPESIVYQRENTCGGVSPISPLEGHAAAPPSLAPAPILRPEALMREPAVRPLPRTSVQPPAQVSDTATPRTKHDSSKAEETSAEALYGQACGYADVGHYEAAIRACQQALAKDALAEKPYYLLAQIAEVQGDIAAAKNFLKRILYLAPASVTAHLELGALYTRERDLSRARKMLHLALELLKALPPDAAIEPFADVPAAQVLLEVQRRIERLGHPAHGLR